MTWLDFKGFKCAAEDVVCHNLWHEEFVYNHLKKFSWNVLFGFCYFSMENKHNVIVVAIITVDYSPINLDPLSANWIEVGYNSKEQVTKAEDGSSARRLLIYKSKFLLQTR